MSPVAQHAAVRRLVLSLSIMLALSGVVLMWYAIHLRHSALSLIASAEQVRTPEDAERQIAVWRQQWGSHYSTSVEDSEQIDKVELENRVLSFLHLVPGTVLSLQVLTRDGVPRMMVLLMYTGMPPYDSGVSIQQDFSSTLSARFSVGNSPNFYVEARRESSGRPFKAIVKFATNATESERKKAFALNVNCLVRLGGCKNAEDILPTVWQ